MHFMVNSRFSWFSLSYQLLVVSTWWYSATITYMLHVFTHVSATVFCIKTHALLSSHFWGFFLGRPVPPRVQKGRLLLILDFIKCQLTQMPVQYYTKIMSQHTKSTLRSKLPRFNFLKKTPKKASESKLDKDLANFVEKANLSRKNSTTTDASYKTTSVLSAKDKQNTHYRIR